MRAAVRYDRLAFSLDIKGWRRWRAVDWPIVAPAAGYAFAVAFCFSFGDLGVIALFGSENFATLPWYLHQKMASYRTDDAAGVALIILGLTLAALAGLPQLLAQKRGAASC
jgi:thiamine transport system permease protein